MRALVALIALCCTASAAAAPGGRPQNLLVLLADDLGVDSVACYAEGSDLPSTPTIDALAAQGVMFRNAWGSPSCSPARAAFQTGRYGFRTGIGAPVVASGYGLPRSEVTLPELFEMHPELGYVNAFFGKWHVGSDAVGGLLAPNLAGWSHYAGSLDNLKEPYDYYHWPLVEDGVLEIRDEYVTTKTVDLALEWLETAPEPWVCVVSFHAAHYPFHAPPAHLHDVALPNVDPREEPRPFFRAMVQALDTEMGRLLAGIGEPMDRTTVVFASDNGTTKEVTVPPFLPLHAKLTPYEGGINVPLIVTGPRVAAPGRESEHLVCLADVFTTAADLAGIDVDATLPGVPTDGRSFLSVIEDPLAPAARQAVYSEHFTPNGFAPDKAIRILRDARYKLILQDVPIEKAEFYDLWRDPWELQNVLASPFMSVEQQAAYQDLRARLDALLP